MKVLFLETKKWLVRRLPILDRIKRLTYRLKPYKSKFRAYYLRGDWGREEESRSGPGSSLDMTASVRHRLPQLLRDYRVRTLLDVPCGDWNWMKEVDLTGIAYTGIEIVPEIVRHNREHYAGPNVDFREGDVIKDALPNADLILCRDCLIHFPDRVVKEALANLKRSGSTYLLTTTYTALDANADIETVGLFRPLNLCRPPFGLPEPLELIPDPEGAAQGRSLGLWSCSDLP